MNKSSMIISTVDPTIALDYLVEHLADSRFVQYLGRDTLTSECEDISIVTSSPHPRDARFNSGFGGLAEPCRLWLIQEAISYLQTTSESVALFEDLNSSPSDLYLTKRDHPPFWHHEGRLFWPVLPLKANPRAVEQAKNWAAAMREAVCFSKLPHNMGPAWETRSLTAGEFAFIASSLKCIVTDVFDGEGYMVWNRRQLEVQPVGCEE